FGPALDRRLIALVGSLDWLLHTVLERAQDATAMRGMIAHAKVALDHFRHSLRRPHLSSISKRFRSLRQYLRQLRQLLRTQFRLRPRRGATAHPLDRLRFRSARPLPHRPFAHP